MRVLVLVKATEESERESTPPDWTAGMLAAMGRFNDDLRKAGILLCAEGLEPSSRGKRVAFEGANRTVMDGPFSPPHDLVAGFWIWDVQDMEEAVAWVRRCPNPMPGPSIIEIRPLHGHGARPAAPPPRA